MRPTMDGTNPTPQTSMTIGEASRLSGFTIKALRFYERCGVLPASTRAANGYRIYGETDLQRLSFIRDAKTLGLTVRAIADIVKASEGNRRKRLLSVLDDSIADATDRIAALTRLRHELERRRRTVAQRRPSNANGHYCSCLKKTELTG
jgi:MerR family transcriptional regulator, copper efflux regulator